MNHIALLILLSSLLGSSSACTSNLIIHRQHSYNMLGYTHATSSLTWPGHFFAWCQDIIQKKNQPSYVCKTTVHTLL